MPPAIPDKIPCTTPAELDRQLDDIRQILSQPETEDNWEKIARALQKYASIVRGGACKVEPEFGKALRETSRAICSAMCSERTRLSATACELVATIAPRMSSFEPHLHLFLPELLKLCTRTNKLFIARSQKTLSVIITHTKLGGILPFLRQAAADKSQTLRVVAVESVLLCIKEFEGKTLIQKVGDVESVLKGTATDSNPEVRKLSKQLFEVYKGYYPERVDDFINPLTPVTKRYLDIAPREKSAPLSKSTAAPSLSKSTAAPSLSKSTHAPKLHPLSASTAAAALPASTEPNQTRPTHTRSGSSALGQPVRPKLLPSQTQTDKPALSKSHSRAPSNSSNPSRPTSALAHLPPRKPISAPARPASALAHSGPSKPLSAPMAGKGGRPFAPARSVTERPVRQAAEGGARGFMRPTASSTSARRALVSSTSASATGPTSAPSKASTSETNANGKASTGPSRPPLSRPPTAPAALHQSASRRPLPDPAQKGKSKASSSHGGKVLQSGAKRVLSAQPTKPVPTPGTGGGGTASGVAQMGRGRGFVPQRGADRYVAGIEAAVREAEEEEGRRSGSGSGSSSPAVEQEGAQAEGDGVALPSDGALAGDVQVTTQEDQTGTGTIEEMGGVEVQGELALEDLVVLKPVEGEHVEEVATEDAPLAEEGAIPARLEEEAVATKVEETCVVAAEREGGPPASAQTEPEAGPELQQQPEEPVAEPVESVPPPAAVDGAVVEEPRKPSPPHHKRHHTHHTHQLPTTEEEKAARLARHEEKRRAFSALSQAEQELLRQRKREKKARLAKEQKEREEREREELARAAAVPLPPPDAEEVSPQPEAEFAVTREERKQSPMVVQEEAHPTVQVEGRNLQEDTVKSPYTVALPTAKALGYVLPTDTQMQEEEAGSSSRSSTPEEVAQRTVHEEEAIPAPVVEEEAENIALLPHAIPEEKESPISDVGVKNTEDDKHRATGSERAFAEVDVNALDR